MRILVAVFCIVVLSESIVAAPRYESVPVIGDERNAAVTTIILHATGGPSCNLRQSFQGGSLDGIIAHFLKNKERISIHYIIGRTGKVVKMVPETQIAYHARGHNSNSIGIELVNDGDGREPFPKRQLDALLHLLHDLIEKYGLDLSAIRGHSEVDKSYLYCNGKRIKRKQDPGPSFPWGLVRNELRQRQSQPEETHRQPLGKEQGQEPRAKINPGSIFQPTNKRILE